MKHLSLLLFLVLAMWTNWTGEVNAQSDAQNLIEGFFIPLPDTWKDHSQLDLKENLEKFKLDEEEIDRLLLTHRGSIPVAVYMKYNPAEFAGPIPTIQVNLRPNPTRNFDGFKSDIERSVGQMGDILSNFSLLSPLEEVDVDGVKGLKFIAQFDLPGQAGEVWTIRSWSYAIPSGRYFYQVNFSDTENENSEEVYAKVIEGVKFRQ